MQAYIAMQRGQLDEAERLARKSLATDPQAAASHNTLGKVLIKQGRFDEASDAFVCAVELDGELLDAAHQSGPDLSVYGPFSTCHRHSYVRRRARC